MNRNPSVAVTRCCWTPLTPARQLSSMRRHTCYHSSSVLAYAVCFVTTTMLCFDGICMVREQYPQARARRHGLTCQGIHSRRSVSCMSRKCAGNAQVASISSPSGTPATFNSGDAQVCTLKQKDVTHYQLLSAPRVGHSAGGVRQSPFQAQPSSYRTGQLVCSTGQEQYQITGNY